MESSQATAPLFIVAVVGDRGVGKTCLLDRIANDSYDDDDRGVLTTKHLTTMS